MTTPAPQLAISSLWAHDADLKDQVDEQLGKRSNASGRRLLLLAFSTLGIVYGDIGTSPLYVFSSIFPAGAPADPNVTLGAASTIVWTITAIVLVKYVLLTLRADDNGEGGIFALYAVICRAAGFRPAASSVLHEADLSLTQYRSGSVAPDSAAPDGGDGTPPAVGRHRAWAARVAARARAGLERSRGGQAGLLGVVMVAAAMILSDGVLTPAISVISAAEGIKYQTGISTGAVVGITCGILVALFALQPFGTQRVAFLFSPAVLVWYVFNTGVAVYNLVTFGATALKALSPSFMYYFWAGRSAEAFKNLGAVLLCVTGAEALYADMSHFSARAVQLSFIGMVYPSLVITYLGQAAVILARPEASTAAYWESVPDALRWPAVVIATSAAIIASQALISGSFTVVQQAISLNLFPRLAVRHTSEHITGQVYVGTINWLLMLATVAIVAGFQTSVKIGNAYGLTVVAVMLVDTSLLAVVMVMAWEWAPEVVAAFWLFYNFVIGALFASTLEKVPQGAWFTLALTSCATLLMWLWHWGQGLKLRYVRDHRIMLSDLLEVDPAGGGPRTAGGSDKAPSIARSSAVSAASTTTKSSSSLGAGLRGGPPPLRLVASGLPVARAPGLGIYYSELIVGVPPVLERALSLLPAVHSVAVFLTVRVVPVPRVLASERLLIRRLRLPGFYHVVARYGYLETPDHGAVFVAGMVQEIFELLHPSTPLTGAQAARLASEASAGGGAAGADGAVANGGTAEGNDLESGLAGGSELAYSAAHQGLVRVGAAESLTATTGAALGRQLSLQLVQLSTSPPASAQSTIHSAAAGAAGSAPRPSLSAITLALALPAGASDEGPPPEDQPAPWVQMPSVVRRVRAQLLGQPAPPPASAAIERWRRAHLAASGGDAPPGTLSLPLPPARGRPRLPPTLPGDATASLPLPPAAPRPAMPPLPAGRAGERAPLISVVAPTADEAVAEALAGATATLRPGAASRQLGQALWTRLGSGAFPSAPPAPPAAAPEPPAPPAADGAAAETRRLLFEVHASPAGSALGEAVPPGSEPLAAERDALLRAHAAGVAYVFGRSTLRAPPSAGVLKRLLLERAYGGLAAGCRPTTAGYSVPRGALLQLGVDYQL